MKNSMVALANWFEMILIHQWFSFEKTFHTLWIPLDGTTLLDPAPWRVDFCDASMCPHDNFCWLDVASFLAPWTWGETSRYYPSILASSFYLSMDLSSHETDFEYTSRIWAMDRVYELGANSCILGSVIPSVPILLLQWYPPASMIWTNSMA